MAHPQYEPLASQSSHGGSHTFVSQKIVFGVSFLRGTPPPKWWFFLLVSLSKKGTLNKAHHFPPWSSWCRKTRFPQIGALQPKGLHRLQAWLTA